MNFGEKSYRLRKEKNLSQEALAELVGTTRQAISKWENNQGYPETEKLLLLSNVFEVSVDFLLKEEKTDSGADKKGYYVSREDRFATSDNNSPFYSKELEKALAVYDEGYANQKGYSVIPLYNDDNFNVYTSQYYRATNASAVFENSFIKGDHIRLNEIYLGYELPQRWMDRQNVFNRINIYARATNLGLIWSKNGEQDPDYVLGNVKPMPTFTFGLKLGFKDWKD